MPIVNKFCENVLDARFDAGGVVLFHSQRARDLVSREKADAVNVARKTIRLIFQNIQRTVAVLFVNFHRQRSADAVRRQKHHHLFDLFLFRPTFLNNLDAFAAHAVHLIQTRNIVLDDVERVESEIIYDAFCGDGPDAFDESTAEIFANAFNRRGELNRKFFDFKLASVRGMIRPNTLQRERFAHTRVHQISNHGDGVRFSFGNEPRDGVAVFFIVKRDALDDAVEGLQWQIRGDVHRGKYK